MARNSEPKNGPAPHGDHQGGKWRIFKRKITVDMVDPDSYNKMIKPGPGDEIVWAVIMPASGVTTYDIVTWRSVTDEYNKVGTTYMDDGTEALLAKHSTIFQYHLNDPCLLQIVNIVGTPSADGFKILYKYTSRSA